jgi:hypothetical protein
MQKWCNMRMPLIIPLALLATACAAPASQFRPTTGGRAESRTGEPAAAYDIRDDSSRIAEVKVWSQGARLAEDGTATLVHVALEVQNVGAAALTLETTTLQLEAFDPSGAPLSSPRLVSSQPPGLGPLTVGAAAAADLDCLFALDPRVLPEQISSLRLRWILLRPDGRQYVQFTDFTRDETRTAGTVYAYVPVFGFYDPYFGWAPLYQRPVIIHHAPVRRAHVPPRRHHWR